MECKDTTLPASSHFSTSRVLIQAHAFNDDYTMPQEPTTSSLLHGLSQYECTQGCLQFFHHGRIFPRMRCTKSRWFVLGKILSTLKKYNLSTTIYLGYLVHIYKDENNENVSLSTVESNNKPDKQTNAYRGKKSKIQDIQANHYCVLQAGMDWGSHVHTCNMGILKDWGLNLWKSDRNGIASMWKSHGL